MIKAMSSVTVCDGRHSPDSFFQMLIQFSSARFTISLPCFSAYCIVRYAPPLLCWIQHTTRSARSVILRLRTWIADFW